MNKTLKKTFSRVKKKLASLLHLRHTYWNTSSWNELP